MNDDEKGKQVIRLHESIHSEKDTINEHFHETFQILYVLDEEGEISLNHKRHSFNADQVAFICPFSNHSIFAHTKLAILVLEFQPEILDSTIHKKLLNDYFEQSKLIEVNRFEAVEIRQLLRKMLYQQSLSEEFDKIGLQVYLLEILYLLAHSQQEFAITDANMLRVEKLKNYIDTNYFNVMNSNDIAKKLGVSSRYVNTIFKEQYNRTPLQYLTEVRLDAAKRLLLETDKDIISICFEVGFESLSTFYRTFSNYIHISPKKYRAVNHPNTYKSDGK